ncbi:MAG: N-acetylglucosaminyldiphosphoundecaprenol N-acetyl-beta-D-mannosaminyltransferase [Fimbriimonadaceae bacterium]|jgi:N-acetylglucosaminyldiphosphoundecaprenol N-acetyl-beta-D-mannosaminyltransferase|nr:N-acetylglucosaminyldiphosphoundecaprenol N-acetyl-beta-D-mannosaminyltransferase [Fimbriimonadaceae bacterium]
MTIQAPVKNRPRVDILGVAVDRLDMPEALARLDEFLKSRTPHIVVTADACGIVQAQTDPEFMEILRTAHLVTPDSAGVLWASKKKGEPIKERVSGVDLTDELCAMSADRGWRIFLLGSQPGVADLAAEKLRLKHPGCNIVGARHGFFPSESDEVVAQEIAALKPDILLVAMGIPRQEKFIRKTQHIIGAPIAMGVGGSLDVFSGKAKRAPYVFQRLKLEWLWRLMLNPSKISKAKFLPRFVSLVLRPKP